jgi:hypothetical protein
MIVKIEHMCGHSKEYCVTLMTGEAKAELERLASVRCEACQGKAYRRRGRVPVFAIG